MTREIDGVGDIADRYRGLVLDLWGVVHNGLAPYPGAVDCLARLRDANITVVMLSNAPRRAAAVAETMRSMGIDERYYRGIVTSGEVTRRLLAHPWGSPIADWGDRFWHLGPTRDHSLFAGLALTQTPLAQADFILNTGPDDERDPTDPAAFDPELRQAAAQGTPMLCANPDLEVVRGGKRIVCAGLLAERFEAMGGVAIWVGKPDPQVYEPALAMIAAPRADIVAIGDSLRTDVAGAKAAGIDCAWVLGGVHKDDDDPAEGARNAGLAPRFSMPRFIW